MPYITIKAQASYIQLTFEEVMEGIQDLSKYVNHNTSNTRTYFAEKVNPKLLENTNIDHMIGLLRLFNQSNEALFEKDSSKPLKNKDILQEIRLWKIERFWKTELKSQIAIFASKS